MGDGANDLPMIETVGIGIAFMAKPIVAERALPYRITMRRGDFLFLEIPRTSIERKQHAYPTSPGFI